jgi:uncharacterized peroxidase-related enzyme
VEGGDPALVDAIKRWAWRDVATLSERDRALCELAEKLSGAPTRMTEADWKPLRQLGFDDRACLELAHVVGIFNHLTRLADGFGLRADAETLRAGETGIALKRPPDPRNPEPSGSDT